MPVPLLEEVAPAKVNLTLRVLGRRADGYHELESLVAFADVADRLALAPGRGLALEVRGPNAAQAGADADNLVLKAANALAGLIPGLILGAFALEKKLPVAAGIGGGSTDAAAALRLLARANNLAGDDPRVYAAARATGADVPVCLDPRTRLMRGIGEQLSAPLKLPPLDAVLVNPGVAVATKDVFAGWRPDGRAGCLARRGSDGAAGKSSAVSAVPAIASERSGNSGRLACPGHRRGARRLAGAAGLRCRPYVGLGRDLLCADVVRRRRGRCGEDDAGQISGLVGAPLRAGKLVRPRDAEIDGLGERRLHR